MFKKILVIFVGIGGGILEGVGIASVLTLLDIVPRLAQVTNSSKLISIYEKTIIVSVVSATLAIFFKYSLYLSDYLLIPIGFILGIFVGLLAAALAEVLNSIPVLEIRLNLKRFIYYALFALSLGKIFGSFIYWLKLVNYK